MTEKDDHINPSISWRHLSVDVSTQWTFKKTPSKKTILHSINGHFTARTLNGILGPSGAGKTTLLNALSGVNSHYSGSIQYFSAQSSSSSQVYYIRQHVHNSVVLELTVSQLLHYAFCFKNNITKANKTARAHIEQTLSALNLPKDLLNRQLSKCSGGELKRVVVAQELMSLAPPSYIILDEPTTGLDSSSAFEVMSCLKRLSVQQKITIIATIHSPNDETLQLFDRLYVLAKGGVSLFEDRPDQLRKTLQEVASLAVPSDQPPIEALLKIACSGPTDPTVIKLAKHHKKQFEKFAKDLETENLNFAFQTFETLKGRKRFRLSNFFTHISRQFHITFIAQLPTLLFSPLFLLFFYTVISTVFDREMTGPDSCFPLINNTTFLNDTSFTTILSESCDSEQRLREETLFKQNAHFLSYVVLMVSFIGMLSSTLIYGRTLSVFKSEHRNRWYSLGVFTASTWIISFLEIILTNLFVAVFSYLISRQHTFDSYFNWTRLQLYVFYVLLIGVYSQSVGHLLGAIFAEWPMIAMISCELVAVSASLFNGMYIKLDRMGNPFMVVLEELGGLAGLSRGILYSIYGFQRCDFEKEYSWVLVEYTVDRKRIVEYAWRAVVNVVIFKLMTLVILWWRFSKKSKPNRNTVVENESFLFFENTTVEVEDKFPTEKLSTVSGEIEMKSKNRYNLSKRSSAQSEYQLRFLTHSKEKILIAWKNLTLLQSSPSCFVSQKQQAKKPPILKNLNGVIRFNSLTALMGTSGAGKTSLLRVLNGQSKTRLSSKSQFYLSSLTFINTCFICQEVSGHLLQGLTTFQMLRYASMLRNRSTNQHSQLLDQMDLEKFDHNAIANRWLAELGLKDAAQTQIENLSGGETKRLSVAIELTAEKMPNLLCLDEPTSGCDSNSAETVVRALKRLTEVHPLLTIVTSIHQPSAEVLALFDQLYVLARGGICIYSGEPSRIQASLDKVASCDSDDQPSSLSPFPIENLIKQSCLGLENTVNQALEKHTRQQFETSAFSWQIAEQTALAADGVQANQARFTSDSVQTLLYRNIAYICAHLWKEWLFFFTCTTLIGASLRILYSPTIATYDGCLNLEDDLSACAAKTAAKLEEEFALKDNLIYGYFFIVNYQMLVVLSASRSFYRDSELFLNEHRNGAYSTGAWYLVKSVLEIIPLIPGILIFVAIMDIYEPVVESEFPVYLDIVLLMILGVLATTAIGHVISLLGGNSYASQTCLVISYILFSLLIGNFVIPIARMHYFWQVAATFSIPRYLLELLMILQYGFGRCQGEKQVSAVLYSMNITEDDGSHTYWHNLRMLLLNAVLFRLLALWLLVRKVNPIENRKRRVERLEAYRKQSLAIGNKV